MFDDPVFERVKRYDRDAATGFEAANRRLEKALELSELVVDRDPQCLESAGRRVDASLAAAFHVLDQTTELGGRTQGILVAAFDDRTGDCPGPPFLAVVAQNSHQLLPLRPLEQVGCGGTASAHAHVEWAICGKAESTLGTVELERGTSDVSKHRHGRTKPESPEDQRQPVEGFLDELHTVTKGLEFLPGPGEGLGITIETDELKFGLRSKQSLGMSSETDRRVDQQTRAGGREQLHHPSGEHREVIGVHSRPPSQLQLREFLEFLIAQRRFLEE